MQEEKNTGAVPTGQTVSTGSTGRGGRRTGAGRKKAEVKKPTIAFRLDVDLIQFMETVPDKTRFLNDAIRRAIVDG